MLLGVLTCLAVLKDGGCLAMEIPKQGEASGAFGSASPSERCQNAEDSCWIDVRLIHAGLGFIFNQFVAVSVIV